MGVKKDGMKGIVEERRKKKGGFVLLIYLLPRLRITASGLDCNQPRDRSFRVWREVANQKIPSDRGTDQ